MANTYLLGFAAVAVIAVAGVDYMVQAQAAGSSPGAYPVGTYIDSFAGRFNGMKDGRAQAARQSVLAKTHLPEAPEGWERREVDPEVAGSLVPNPGQEAAQPAGDDFLSQQVRKQALREARATAKQETWEYVRGDEVIRLSARYVAPSEAAPAPAAAGIGVAPQQDAWVGYAVIQGVPFLQRVVAAPQEADTPDATAIVPVALVAQIGSDVSLRAEARATPESLRLLLEAIDYDALNAMLDAPVPGIGSAAPALSPEDERLAADAAAAARLAAQMPRPGAPADVAAAADTAAPAPADRIGRITPDAGQGNALSRLSSFFGSGKATGDAGQAQPADKPRRIELSGGASCLAGSAGRFCRE